MKNLTRFDKISTSSLCIALSIIAVIKLENCRPLSSNFVEMPFCHVTKINLSRRNLQFIVIHLEEPKLEAVQAISRVKQSPQHHTVFTSTVFCHFASERARGSMPWLLVRNRRRLLIFVLLIERHCLLMSSSLLDNEAAESCLNYSYRTVNEHNTHILFLMHVIRGSEPRLQEMLIFRHTPAASKHSNGQLKV